MTYFKIKNYDDVNYINSFESTVVKSYTYDDLNLTLMVKFSDDSEYLYSGVPYSVAMRFQITPSKGSFIYRQLKGYPYKKIST